MDYKELMGKIKSDIPERAIEIVECLELLRMTIENTFEDIGEKINDSYAERDYKKINCYSNIAEEIEFYEDKINDLINLLDIDKIDNKEDSNYSEYELRDYDKYKVDNRIEYNLYNDFTNKRPYGFKVLESKMIYTKTWKEMLVEVCKIFYDVDKEKFNSFIDLDRMNGRKKYFSKDGKDLRYPARIGNNVYIETNKCANDIRDVIIKILREYGLKAIDLKVFLTADYSDLKKDKKTINLDAIK